MKVLLIAYNNLGKGGIQNQIMGIVRSLKDKANFDIVIWDSVRDYYRPELEQYNVNIIECFRSAGKSTLWKKADTFLRYHSIRKTTEDVIDTYGPYDVIHCHNAYDAAPCLEAAYRKGIPVRISHAHNTENPSLHRKRTYPAYKVLYAHNRRKIHRYATHRIGCSKEVADYFFGKDAGQVVHIGIDLTACTEIDIPKRDTSIRKLLHVGSMGEQKNQLFLAEMMEQLVQIRNDVHLTMIGGGTEYLEKVRNLMAEKQLEDYITILPPETDVPQAMAEADLFVFPSTFEGFGIVLIEAQAAGLPCIASDIVSKEADCGGIQYYPLAEGAANWAEMIHRKIEDGLSHERKYDVSEFSVENMSRCMYEIYDHSGR